MKPRLPWCIALIKNTRQNNTMFETVGRLVYYLLSLKYFVRLLKIV